MSITRKEYIHRHKALFWYTPENKLDEISDSFLVETILNYGNMYAIKDLFQLIGIKKTAEIFFHSINLSERRKNNYHELTLNYFTLLFNRYAR
jgi:predicted nucleotidyltransferase